MKKIGFAINLASAGLTTALVCNKGQWTNKVVDIREFFKLFSGLANIEHGTQVSTGLFATFMSFDSSGCFITQMKALNGRIGDFLAGWIYIPNTIEASGDEILTAYNYVRNILSMSNITDMKEDIDSFFSKEYSSKEVAAQYAESRGQFYGIRYLGHYSLKEIVGEHRYQPYYSDYKVVFLLNKGDEVSVAKEAYNYFKDLTKNEIIKTAVLVPPTNAELEKLGRGTKLLTSNGSVFNQPMLVNLGTKVTLLFSRSGFENMKLDIPVTSERQVFDISKIRITWKKRISASMFTVKNQKHETIEHGVRIAVNGTDVTYQDILIPEDECRQAMITVTAPDYDMFEQFRNLSHEDFIITLNQKVKSIQAIVELSNGNLAEMTLESKYLSSNKNESPLKGYQYEDNYHGSKILKMDNWFIWKQRLWGFFGSFVVLAIIAICLMVDAWIDKGYPMPWDDKKVPQTDARIPLGDEAESGIVEEEVNTDSENTLTIEDAIKYLDLNPVWTKNEMEKYPDLRGLFDDMNNFNLQKIISDWNTTLSASQKFKEVCKSANKTYTNSWNPKQGQHNPTYNKPDDEQISLTNYINWLDQDQTPKPSSNNGGFHPNVGANSGKNASKSGSTSGKSGASPAKQGTGKSEKTTNGGL